MPGWKSQRPEQFRPLLPGSGFRDKFHRATRLRARQYAGQRGAQKAVISSLVANVAGSYFTLRQLDMQLEISRRTLASHHDSLQLTQTLKEHGFNTMLNVRQAQQLVYTAATFSSPGISSAHWRPGFAHGRVEVLFTLR